MNLIELNNISKHFRTGFKQKKVLNEVNLVVKPGEFVVLGGANGAGKTTLLNIILGLLKPDSGKVQLFDCSPQDSKSKTRVGVVLQKVAVPKHLKVKELVDLLRSYYPNPLSTEEILKTVNLNGKHDAWASNLSGGEEQRLYFALALAGNPDLLILDEPTRNLDKDGFSDFWNQVKICREKGIAILMVTNNQSDWEELNHIATRSITICDGKICEDKVINNGEIESTIVPVANQIQNHNSTKLRWLFPLFKQTWVELVQLVRTPLYLLGIFIFSSLIGLVSSQEPKELGLLFFAGISLLTFAIDRLGKRVAAERIEGWLKLLRVTPLPPAIYLAAKIIMALLVLAVNLSLVFSLGAWKMGIEETPRQWITMFLSLVLGVMPFAILGLALGYLFKPKTVDSIIGLSIPLAVATCGLPFPYPKFVQDLVTYSPFYHYGQLALWSAGLDYDNRLVLHMLWLIWAGFMFSFLAIWAYRRDEVLQ
ncbi:MULTISPECIES: ABC transporter ATP-binding protein/permease [unclassified Microcoleus]|uniref:ABC transporter ATP-binding protein/permease n=1 Tax=unclassified Microcoleus TaxID=2642155 RepID=UPI002FD37074